MAFPFLPSRRVARLRRSAGILAGLWLAVHPTVGFAAPRAAVVRPSFPTGRFPGASFSPSSPLSGGRFSSSDLAQLRTLAERDRLAAASARGYEIIPPARPDLHPGGPVPGYQTLRLGRGHFNRLCLAATVASTRGLLMVDTGVSNTALSGETYRALRLNASYRLPARVPRALSLNGTSVPVAQAPDFALGNAANLGAVPVGLLPRPYLTDPGSKDEPGRVYDGLLGENILRHYRAIIDCGRLMLYLNVDPARRLDLAASFARHGWTRVPLTDTGSHFVVPCAVNGRRFRLVVDTGSPFTNLDRDLLASAGVPCKDLPLRGGLIGMDSRAVGLAAVDRLQIGGYTATGVHLTAIRQSFADFDGHGGRSAGEPILGLLGGDILAQDGAIIDLGTRSLYLKRPAPESSGRERTAAREHRQPATG